MDFELKNKVVVVSGSSRGIGYAIAEAFLKEGARVVLTGRNPQDLEKAKQKLSSCGSSSQILAVEGDLRIDSGIKNLIAQTQRAWRQMDILVSNLGSGIGKSGVELEESDWTDAFEINFSAAIKLVKNVLPFLLKSKTASILFINSIAGLEALSAPIPYGAAKAALLNVSKNLSRELASQGIRVNSISPGNILCEGGSWEKKLKNSKDEMKKYLHDEVPQNRFGTPDEIANAAVFLSSARASFITGANLVIDGGQSRSL